jgi:hypothetical protein
MSEDIYALPKTQPEAIRVGSPFYFSGKPCKHGHVAKRDVRYHCVECEMTLRNTPKQKKKRLDVSKSWYKDNKHREDLKLSRRRRTKKWRDQNPERSQLHRVRGKLKRYGLLLHEYEQLLQEQKNKCAICLEKQNNWCIDHNHTTGKVRGLLCHKCNIALGFINDDPKRAQRAAKYLIRNT